MIQQGMSRRELLRGGADDATMWLKDLGEKTFYGG